MPESCRQTEVGMEVVRLEVGGWRWKVVSRNSLEESKKSSVRRVVVCRDVLRREEPSNASNGTPPRPQICTERPPKRLRGKGRGRRPRRSMTDNYGLGDGRELCQAFPHISIKEIIVP